MIKNRGIAFKLSFFILTSCSVIFIGIFGYNYFLTRSIIVKNIEENASNLTRLTVNKIATVLLPIEKVPQNIAYSLEYSSYTKEELIDLLRSVIENNPEVYGSAIAFQPYAFQKDTLYFAPYFYKSGGQIKFRYLGSDTYRYFNWDWYQIPKELGHSIWTEPYYDEGGGDIIMSTYSVPFYRNIQGKREFMGVVTADVSLSWLQDIVSSIKIGKTGYGFLISQNGMIVTHPHKNLIMNDTIFGLAELQQDQRLREVGREMIQGKSGFIPFKSIASGKKTWLAYAPLVASKWSLGIVFPQDELMGDVIRLNNIVFVLGLLGFFVLLAVIVLVSRSITGPLRLLAETTKDIARGDLEFDLSRIKSQDEVGKLAESFIYMKGALNKYIKELTAATQAKERIESELKIAHDIQMGILPKVFPPFPQRTEFDIYAVLEPAREVGGDFYDFFLIDHNRLCFVIADVSGKGVPAALFMAMAKALIKAIARQTHDPAEIIKKVNKELSYENESCMFITIFCSVLNIKTGELDYVNAGHNPPLVIRKQEELEFLKGTGGYVVGIKDGLDFKKARTTLEPGDTILLYTDGVTEAFNDREEVFSEERLLEETFIYRSDPIQDLVKAILGEIKSFSLGMPQSDDITILALRYFSSHKMPGGSLEQKKQITLVNNISEIEKLKAAVFEFGRANQLSEEVIHDMALAFEEALTNIISYAYRDRGEHKITVCFTLKDEELLLEIRDDGKPFNPLEFPAPDIDKPLTERQVGGLGIHLFRTLMDKLEYKRISGKNILLMKKKIV